MSEVGDDLILLVDDDSTGRSVRKLVLELRNHKVLAVGDADMALNILRTEPVKLAILDYFLQNTTGTELARKIRQVQPDLPILLLSGSGEAPSGLEHVDRYLCKMDSVEVIEKAIAELLEKRTPEMHRS